MDSLLEPVELNRENGDTSAPRSPRRSEDVSPTLDSVLDEIRSGAESALYGTDTADAEEKLNRYVLPLIEG